jgi:hypothetical protein
MRAKYRNPANGRIETVSGLTWLWVLLFGCFYFAARGVWGHFVISLGAGILTLGLSWLIYPFIAGGIMRSHFRRMGWVRVKKKKLVTTPVA